MEQVASALEGVVGERDAIDIPREIAQGVLAAADLLDVNGPGALPDCGIEIEAQAGALEGSAQLRAKDSGERIAGHEEARISRLDPGSAIRGEPTGRNEEMGVRMVIERARPAVQDREDADRATDPGRVIRE